ncbi:MAG: hypothetical protein IJ996_06420 [Clostridia bacterium]|nr:hypothetical protein [Clostridia bacterium]
MKKLLCCLLAFCTVGALAGCNNGNGSTGSGSSLKLSYNTKYINKTRVNDQTRQDYYIFYKDGTADYYYRNPSQYNIDTRKDEICAYTTHYRYVLVEEENMVFCFYNGISYDQDDEYKMNLSTTDTSRLMYTEDFIMTTGGTMYVTQAFIETVPNFGKTE